MKTLPLQFICHIALLLVCGVILDPVEVLATATGGGYIVHDQINSINGVSSGAGYTTQSGGNPAGGVVTGGGFTNTGGTYFSSTSTTPTDVCPNIAGVQETVPSGKTINGSGNCVNSSSGGGGSNSTPTPQSCPTGTTGTYPSCVPGTPGITIINGIPVPSTTATQAVTVGVGQTTPDGLVAGTSEELAAQQRKQYTMAFRADIDDDRTVGIFDFNLVMVNWDKNTGNVTEKVCSDRNIADINCDTEVDIFDFNLLMIHWGKNLTNLI